MEKTQYGQVRLCSAAAVSSSGAGDGECCVTARRIYIRSTCSDQMAPAGLRSIFQFVLADWPSTLERSAALDQIQITHLSRCDHDISYCPLRPDRDHTSLWCAEQRRRRAQDGVASGLVDCLRTGGVDLGLRARRELPALDNNSRRGRTRSTFLHRNLYTPGMVGHCHTRSLSLSLKLRHCARGHL